jgi:hypothetical protein
MQRQAQTQAPKRGEAWTAPKPSMPAGDGHASPFSFSYPDRSRRERMGQVAICPHHLVPHRCSPMANLKSAKAIPIHFRKSAAASSEASKAARFHAASGVTGPSGEDTLLVTSRRFRTRVVRTSPGETPPPSGCLRGDPRPRSWGRAHHRAKSRFQAKAREIVETRPISSPSPRP